MIQSVETRFAAGETGRTTAAMCWPTNATLTVIANYGQRRKRASILALIGGDTVEPAVKQREIMPPACPVFFGKLPY